MFFITVALNCQKYFIPRKKRLAVKKFLELETLFRGRKKILLQIVMFVNGKESVIATFFIRSSFRLRLKCPKTGNNKNSVPSG